MRKVLLLVVVLCAGAALAQDSTDNNRDYGVWFAGGHSVPGGTGDTSVFSAGVRMGWILTGDHGPGILRGNFEYAIDLVPVYVVHQFDTTYGAGFNPIDLKWNFTAHKKVVPYLELGGGTLFSTKDVPPGTDRVNFRTHVSFGTHLKARGGQNAVTLEARYEHISNAGLASPNPGINTVQFMLGFNTFRCGLFSSCKPK